MAKTSTLVRLAHYRWAIPVLAELERTSGSKFVTLLRRLGISRDSLRRTLRALVQAGWVRRNPGYGHPLRPEYILTTAGARLAPAVAQLAILLRELRIEDPALDKWSLPVMAALAESEMSFSALKKGLPGITSRALTLTLKELIGAGLVERKVLPGYPPATSYSLTVWGRRLSPALSGLRTLA